MKRGLVLGFSFILIFSMFVVSASFFPMTGKAVDSSCVVQCQDNACAQWERSFFKMICKNRNKADCQQQCTTLGVGELIGPEGGDEAVEGGFKVESVDDFEEGVGDYDERSCGYGKDGEYRCIDEVKIKTIDDNGERITIASSKWKPSANLWFIEDKDGVFDAGIYSCVEFNKKLLTDIRVDITHNEAKRKTPREYHYSIGDGSWKKLDDGRVWCTALNEFTFSEGINQLTYKFTTYPDKVKSVTLKVDVRKPDKTKCAKFEKSPGGVQERKGDWRSGSCEKYELNKKIESAEI